MTKSTPQPTPKKSDLGVRTASAIVMVAVAGTALWLGGWVWTVFVAAVALGVLWEWRGLVFGFEPSPVKRGLWNIGGMVYAGIAGLSLTQMRFDELGLVDTLAVVLMVIFIDVGAYFAGRTFGGPKIAPKISPSKTWSGLGGGVIGAAVVIYLAVPGLCYDDCPTDPLTIWAQHLQLLQLNFSWADIFFCLGIGALGAGIAQSGDFFESWMKRRAGVKDSGNLIPGHGGLFDRVDGLLAVSFIIGLFRLPAIIGSL